MPDGANTTTTPPPPRTMFAKLWESHVVAELSDDTALLHVDRHILHDLGGSRALLDVRERGLPVHSPELTFATIDHTISSSPGRQDTIARGVELMKALRTETAAVGIRLFDVGRAGPGHRACHGARLTDVEQANADRRRVSVRNAFISSTPRAIVSWRPGELEIV